MWEGKGGVWGRGKVREECGGSMVCPLVLTRHTPSHIEPIPISSYIQPRYRHLTTLLKSTCERDLGIDLLPILSLGNHTARVV